MNTYAGKHPRKILLDQRQARQRRHKILQSFTEAVYRVVAGIPRGRVLTYQEVARQAGRPNAYRAVGNILHRNPDMKRVPCHRVIRKNGDIGGYALGTARKRKRLIEEGAL